MIEIHTSDRNHFRRCRQAWDFGSPLRQRYKGVVGIPALDFGVAIHKALEVYYDPKLQTVTKGVREALALASFHEELKEQQHKVPLEMRNETLQERWTEQSQLGSAMIKHYFLWAPKRDTKLVPKYSEIEFEVPIPTFGNDVVYRGRIDLIAEDDHGDLWIIDHKTTAQFNEDMEWLDLDTQGSAYYWALWQQLGLQVSGVIYNQLRKSAPKDPEVLIGAKLSRNKSQRTSAEWYQHTLQVMNLPAAEYADFLAFLRNEPSKQFFRRIQVHRSPRQLEVIESQIVREVSDMLTDPHIYPNPGLFNCRGCSYRAPCMALHDGSDVDYILNVSGLFRKY